MKKCCNYTMSPLKQRIAIAEWLGYTTSPPLNKEKSIIGWMKGGQYIPRIPDYLNDMNAILDAESTLAPTMRGILFGYLYKMGGCMQETVYLTAAQRSECFLKTINKWED